MNLLLLTGTLGTVQAPPPSAVTFGYGGWQAAILTGGMSLLFVLILG